MKAKLNISVIESSFTKECLFSRNFVIVIVIYLLFCCKFKFHPQNLILLDISK